MGKGHRSFRLKHPLLAGLLLALAALASSNVSQAGPIVERGWDRSETVPGPAPGTVDDPCFGSARESSWESTYAKEDPDDD
jgi:hypothetical protein